MYKTAEERTGWLVFAYRFHVIRPSLHLISKVTAMLFFFMFATTIEWLAYFWDNYPKTTNIIVTLLSYKAADYLEDKVAKAISAFTFAFPRFKESVANMWIVIGSLLVLIPLVAISAVTSFSGIQGNIKKGDLGLTETQEKLKEIESTKSSSSAKAALLTYKAERKELRANIEKERDLAKTNSTNDCKSTYPTDKAERTSCINSNLKKIDEVFGEKLMEFDQVTENGVNDIQTMVNNETAKSMENKDKLIAMLHDQVSYKNDQIELVAWVVGWGAMVFEAFALIAALLVNFVLFKCKATEEDMEKEGATTENNKGIFREVWDGIYGFFLGRRKK